MIEILFPLSLLKLLKVFYMYIGTRLHQGKMVFYFYYFTFLNLVTHSVVVRPRTFGIFNYTSALVTYYPTSDAKQVTISYSTAPGESKDFGD
jgi:hypothetical protein